ncbi:MAG TPA: anthranilate synthase component I family protein [Kineosporiaceae bacterium]|nr:anthranilate synthase component I family protein [Kineosporiaceae bacterium]
MPPQVELTERLPGAAWFSGVLADRLVEVSDDLAVLDRRGWWAVVITFEGVVRLYRFARRRAMSLPAAKGRWRGPGPGEWTSSLDGAQYRAGVREIRRRIREGEVYQVNLCRVLSAPITPDDDPWALARLLAHGNPAPYAGVIDVPDGPGRPGTRLVTASPELFLSRRGDLVTSSPIKGTAETEAGLLPKDRAENVMIVDLVRNDLQRVCMPGSVEVSSLLEVQQHPGLVHLVSTVQGRLGHAGWAGMLAATSPPGSVSGAPKSSALRAIADLEPVPRGPYCGAVGWVDADRDLGRLAVGIRTFWWEAGSLRFGTGAGITWGSDPDGEWDETLLKARHLVALAGGHEQAGDRHGKEAPGWLEWV